MIVMQKLKPHKLSVQSSAEVAKVCQVQLLLAIISKKGQEQPMPLLTAHAKSTMFRGLLKCASDLLSMQQ